MSMLSFGMRLKTVSFSRRKRSSYFNRHKEQWVSAIDFEAIYQQWDLLKRVRTYILVERKAEGHLWLDDIIGCYIVVTDLVERCESLSKQWITRVRCEQEAWVVKIEKIEATYCTSKKWVAVTTKTACLASAETGATYIVWNLVGLHNLSLHDGHEDLFDARFAFFSQFCLLIVGCLHSCPKLIAVYGAIIRRDKLVDAFWYKAMQERELARAHIADSHCSLWNYSK